MTFSLLNKATLFSLVLCVATATTKAQQLPGRLSGDLQLNANFFQRDSSIGAAGTPMYDNLLSGGEAWFTLNYSLLGFDAGIRFDAFQHSNLHNPQKPYTDQGLGYWYLKKSVKEL